MKRTDYLGLFVLGLLVAVIAAQWVRVPGYMDAEYYYFGGAQLAQGAGFTQSFLWNYLDEPVGLPHPSHTYWMPLASLTACLGMALFGAVNFVSAQYPFILLAACLPGMTAWLAYRIGGQVWQARLAGLLAAVPGFYLPYLVTTESFGLYMLFGGLIVFLSFPEENTGGRRWMPELRFGLLGTLAGLMHLSRADGLLWLLGVLGLAVFEMWRNRKSGSYTLLAGARLIVAILAGYALVMSFWYWRNLKIFGSLMPPGGSRALWLTEYDQTFAYPAALLNPQSWMDAGIGAALRARLDALWQNLKTWVGVQGAVVLLPLMLAGLWTLRRDRRVRFAAIMWLATLAFMTAVFPFAGARGGFLHSGAAFQLMGWVGAAAGFDAFIQAGVRLRGWSRARAWKMFAPALVILIIVLTGVLYFQRVIGIDVTRPAWVDGWKQAHAIEQELVRLGAQPDAVVMINNPPGYTAASGRASIVIPYGDITTTLAAAQQYQADYLVLEENHVEGLDLLYENPQTDSHLKYLGAFGKAQFFKILTTGGEN